MSTIDHGDFKNVHGKPVHSVILVTGATGNVGRHVVTQLLHTGARVRALARDPASAGLPGGVDVVRGDLSRHSGRVLERGRCRVPVVARPDG
jgi:nucleoside-diphosphate-sugar epimerase